MNFILLIVCLFVTPCRLYSMASLELKSYVQTFPCKSFFENGSVSDRKKIEGALNSLFCSGASDWVAIEEAHRSIIGKLRHNSSDPVLVQQSQEIVDTAYNFLTAHKQLWLSPKFPTESRSLTYEQLEHLMLYNPCVDIFSNTALTDADKLKSAISILQVEGKTNLDDIDRQFRAISRNVHPDRFSTHEPSKELANSLQRLVSNARDFITEHKDLLFSGPQTASSASSPGPQQQQHQYQQQQPRPRQQQQQRRQPQSQPQRGWADLASSPLTIETIRGIMNSFNIDDILAMQQWNGTDKKAFFDKVADGDWNRNAVEELNRVRIILHFRNDKDASADPTHSLIYLANNGLKSVMHNWGRDPNVARQVTEIRRKYYL